MIGLIVVLLLISNSIILFLANYQYSLIMLAISIIILIIFKVKFTKLIHQLKLILPFIIIVFLGNIIFDTLLSSIIVCLKIFCVCIFGYAITFKLSPKQIAKGLTLLLYFLKIFKVDLKRIELMIIVALNYINILKNEMIKIKLSLLSKGVRFKGRRIFKDYIILLKIYIQNIFIKINEIEFGLLSKGFI